MKDGLFLVFVFVYVLKRSYMIIFTIQNEHFLEDTKCRPLTILSKWSMQGFFFFFFSRAGIMYTFTHVNINKQVNVYKFQPMVKYHHVQPIFSLVSFLVVHQFFTKISHHLRLKFKFKHGKQNLYWLEWERLHFSEVAQFCSHGLLSVIANYIIFITIRNLWHQRRVHIYMKRNLPA